MSSSDVGEDSPNEVEILVGSSDDGKSIKRVCSLDDSSELAITSLLDMESDKSG